MIDNSVVRNFSVEEVIGYEFVQGVARALGIISILCAVPLFGKHLEVGKSVYTVGIEHVISLYEAGVFMVL